MLVVPDEFILVLFMMAIHCVTHSFSILAFVAPARKKFFTPEHLGQFAEDHKKEYPENEGVDPTGNPDQGTGWYSKKMPLKEWVEMNTKIRASLNYMETLPLILIPAPIAALYFPLPALGFIIGAWSGNFMYMCGYAAPPGESGFKVIRPLGVLIRVLCILGNIICAMWSSIEVIKYGGKLMKVEGDRILCIKDTKSIGCTRKGKY